MTKINKIIIHGFKSFAEKTELTFGDGFNCILGPNGSGKSNIFDAICFVLGKGSAKGLRAEKSANLIYNGGKSKNPAKQGEVSIFFDNTKKTFPTEEDEVKITRIVRANGQSIYKINDNKRTREEILELLSLAKIDPDGYNIVLQGDIVRFVDMSPTDKRMIIEDIAGISIYEEKKNKAENELEKVNNKLGEVDIVMKERKTYLDQLKDERKQAVKFKELEGKIKQNKATLLHRDIKKKKEQRDEIDRKLNDSKNKLKKFQDEVNDLKKKISEKKDEIQEINKNIEERGEKDQVALHKEVENIKVDMASKNSKIESYTAEIAKIESRKEQLNENLEDIEKKIEDMNAELQSLTQDKEAKQKELDIINEKIDAVKKKYDLDSISSIEQEIEKIDRQIDEQQKKSDATRLQQQEFLREKDKLEIQISNIDEKIDKLLEVEKEHKKELEELKQKKQEFKKTTLDLNKALNEDSSLAAQLKQTREKLIKVEEKISELKIKNASLNEKMQGDIAIKRIMDNKSGLGQIFGPVYELGEVNKKYALALEVAAGGRIKSIVVQDDKVAADCIKYLKTNKLGVASFLPLNKIKGSERNIDSSKYKKMNGVHGMASELVKYDQKFRKVFEYVFGSSLVVDNIDAARRIGVGSVRMVTLTGDLVETSGAMHGGYRQRNLNASFKQKELVDELSTLEKDQSEFHERISSIESRRQQLDDSIVRLRDVKANLEGDIIRMEKSLHLEPEETELNNKMKDEMKGREKEIDKKIDEINDKIADETSALAELKVERQKLKSQISEMRDPTKLAELNAFEQKRDEFRSQMADIDAKIKSTQMQLDTVIKSEKENISRIIKQNAKEKDNFDSEIKKMKKDIESLGKDLKSKEEKEKKFYEQFKSMFKKRNDISDEIQKLEIKTISKEENMRNIEQKINSSELEMTKYRTEISLLEKEYEPYKDVTLSNQSDQALKLQITQFEKMVSDIGSVNMRAIELYDQLENEYNNLIKKKEKLEEEKNDVVMMMEEIETKKKDAFLETYDQINENFKKNFKKLSSKGDAYLSLEVPEDPLSGGMSVRVKLTTNKFMDIRSLSGGEKTLTALAFIFAVQEHDPASFYVFDEVDAALDKRNSERLGELIKSYAGNAQYVIVTHNDSIISDADILYGVSMREDAVSKVVSLRI